MPPDLGGFRREWLEVIAQEIERLRAAAIRILPRLMSEAADDPELHGLVLETMVEPRRAVAKELVRRGQARGELRPELDPELVVDLLIGPLLYRALLEGGASLEPVRGMSERILDAVLAGLAP